MHVYNILVCTGVDTAIWLIIVVIVFVCQLCVDQRCVPLESLNTTLCPHCHNHGVSSQVNVVQSRAAVSLCVPASRRSPTRASPCTCSDQLRPTTQDNIVFLIIGLHGTSNNPLIYLKSSDPPVKEFSDPCSLL